MTKQEKKKFGRKVLSIIKLYRLGQDFANENPKIDMRLVVSFIEYVNKHKNE